MVRSRPEPRGDVSHNLIPAVFAEAIASEIPLSSELALRELEASQAWCVQVPLVSASALDQDSLNFRADSEMATTAGCFNLRSTESA